MSISAGTAHIAQSFCPERLKTSCLFSKTMTKLEIVQMPGAGDGRGIVNHGVNSKQNKNFCYIVLFVSWIFWPLILSAFCFECRTANFVEKDIYFS